MQEGLGITLRTPGQDSYTLAMRHRAVLVHAPGLAASRVEEAAGKSWASPTERAVPPKVPIHPRGSGKGYCVGQLDAAWTQSAPSPPAPAPPPANARSEGLTPTRALPPAPALQPLKLPCPHRCATPDAGPPAGAGLGTLRLGVKPPLPSILSSPANSGPSGWLERVTSSHSPLACASHCEARATRISTSLYRHKDLLYSDFNLMWWPHTYTCACTRTHSPGSSVTLAPVGRGSSPSSETPLPSQALQPDMLPPPSVPAQRRT